MSKNKKIFSDEERQYIIDNWGKESAHSMKNKFNCSWYSICSVAKENDLEMPKSNEWTKEEIETLTLLASKYDYKTIARIMKKSETSIYLKARRMNITLIQRKRKWEKEEEQLLKELWGYTTIEKIAKKLKRTVFSIKVKAIRMKLGSMISNNYEIITITDVAEILDVTRDRIMNTWVSLGLKIDNIKVSEQKSYYGITVENLLDFLERNQYEWDSRNLEEEIFGVEPDWLLDKRKRDKLENPLWYRRWSDSDIKTAEQLFKIKKTYKEIAEIVDRSEWSVANLLRDLGYIYKMPKYWTGKEIKYLRENYQTMSYDDIAKELNRTSKAIEAKALELGYKRRIKK